MIDRGLRQRPRSPFSTARKRARLSFERTNDHVPVTGRLLRRRIAARPVRRGAARRARFADDAWRRLERAAYRDARRDTGADRMHRAADPSGGIQHGMEAQALAVRTGRQCARIHLRPADRHRARPRVRHHGRDDVFLMTGFRA
ncbi:hypothetical protein BDI4_1200042 [Burkholderia diffusa]|nr:hypothetical protein BDI4_1200042 [Burkholderia diffusa]